MGVARGGRGGLRTPNLKISKVLSKLEIGQWEIVVTSAPALATDKPGLPIRNPGCANV